MPRLIGKGIGVGTALGTAIVVQVRGGIAITPPPSPRIAHLEEMHRVSELPEVVLICDDYRIATTIADTLTWAKVVGIAATNAGDDDPVTSVPAVVDLKRLLEQVEEDQLVLVDASRGVVLVDPDPVFLAQYTAEHDNVAPRRRTYLDDAHRRATTQDGLTVSVLAYAENVPMVQHAMDNGADALVVSATSDLFSTHHTPDTMQMRLDSLIEAAPGKAVVLVDDYHFPRRVLCESALRADIILALPPRTDLPGLGVAEERDTLFELERTYIEDDIPCSVPRLALSLDDALSLGGKEAVTELVGRFAATGASRVIVGFEPAPRSRERLTQLSYLCDACRDYVIPVIVALRGFGFTSEEIEIMSRDLIGLGVAGMVVAAGHIQDAKASIRSLNAEECREELLKAE